MPIATFSGLASGIDSASLIQALIDERKKVKLKPLQRDLAEVNAASSKLTELKGLAQKLAEKARVFSPVYGGPLYKKATTSNDQIATATATSNAVNGTYSLNITQLAKTSSVTFNQSYSSANSPLVAGINDSLPAADRTLTITYGQGSSQVTKNFVLTSSTTVQQFIDDFNTQFSGVASALLINVGTSSNPDYRVLLKSAKQGTQEGFVDFSVSTTPDPILNSWVMNKTVDQAQNLNMTISGITGTIVKTSNTFSDLIPGVTFTIKQTGSAEITVDLDQTDMINKLQAFVDAYNDVVRFVRKENKTTVVTNSKGESDPKFGSLTKVRVDDGFIEQLRQKLTSLNAYSGTPPPTAKVFKLPDIGISTQGKDETGAFDGTLVFTSSGSTTSSFTKALQDDLQGVINLLTNLGNELGTTTGLIEEYTAYNKLFDTSLNSLGQQKKDIESKISEAEKALQAEEATLTQTFARLESTIGRLRSLQTNLAQALATLPRFDNGR
ncbi:MAG: flagellar filament capping protein FliD [Deltaproteobacteria bacterium]|nr:flagellar filament capping protein FliD [Deltaproteobacteria bacterium]MCX7952084.1 flagellar filament capping protein FliD [Deltaproteobacteria bacterium]